MGINKESDVAANLQIGPTSIGMVRIYVEAEGMELPLDFDPDEADEIAEELRGAAQAARAIQAGSGAGTGRGGSKGRGKGPKR
jgi:hypothetical protein